MRTSPLAVMLAWAVPAECWALSAWRVQPQRSASSSTRRWASPTGTSSRKDALWVLYAQIRHHFRMAIPAQPLCAKGDYRGLEAAAL